ncbi:MAG: TniB family NTP-binding protein [Clostridia bacterium]|nr:TniB family NTP-binding protein [Clostridia bacterium]
MDKNKEFAERVVCLNVEHTKIVRIFKVLDDIRVNRNMVNAQNSQKHSFIIGRSGVGKTIMAKRYAEKNLEYMRIGEAGKDRDVRPVLYVEVPNPFTAKDFYQTVIAALDVPQLLGKPTIKELENYIVKLLKEKAVEMLILDEVDHVLSTRYVKTLEAIENIMHFGSEANVSLVFMGTQRATKLWELNNEYFKRFTLIHLEQFNGCDAEFCSFLNEVEDQLAPEEPIGFGNLHTGLPQLLYAMCRGIVGFLTPILQEAYRLRGVFDTNFTDSASTKLDAKVLGEAYRNIVGDLTQDELDRIVVS